MVYISITYGIKVSTQYYKVLYMLRVDWANVA